MTNNLMNCVKEKMYDPYIPIAAAIIGILH